MGASSASSGDWLAAEVQAFAPGQPLQQVNAACLVQWHVAGAAGGKVNARRAAAFAIAGFDQAQGHVQQPVEHLKTFLGQANAAGVVVVHEDSALAQLWVQRVADAADVGAVAQRRSGYRDFMACSMAWIEPMTWKACRFKSCW